jgi:Notch-like protein
LSSQATAVVHKNGRDIKGCSTAAKGQMWECFKGCPHAEYESFYEYYGSHTYADDWVNGAIAGTNVVYPNGRGSTDFFKYSDDVTRPEAIKKGTACLNIWMYAVRAFELAIRNCEISCPFCNDDPVYAWDEDVALHSGSLLQPQARASSLPRGRAMPRPFVPTFRDATPCSV